MVYYQKNIPYTLNPGGLKYNEDFVTNFLEVKRKCVLEANLSLSHQNHTLSSDNSQLKFYDNIRTC